MRTLNYLCALILSIAFTSCDIIEGPFTEEVIVEECTEKCKKILLEDYTGSDCGHCPRAAEKAEELKEIYGDQLITITVHAGFFANPELHPSINDFTTTTGDEWDTYFGNSSAGNPNGMANRIGYPEANHILQYSQWGQKIDELIQTEAEAYIELEANYNESTNIVDINAETEILQSINAPLSLNIMITESGIIAPQKDYDATPQWIENYEHNHVLRKSLTESWGDDLGQSDYLSGDIINNTFSLSLEETWVYENISIVAFITNTNTYEVIQTEEIHMIE